VGERKGGSAQKTCQIVRRNTRWSGGGLCRGVRFRAVVPAPGGKFTKSMVVVRKRGGNRAPKRGPNRPRRRKLHGPFPVERFLSKSRGPVENGGLKPGGGNHPPQGLSTPLGGPIAGLVTVRGKGGKSNPRKGGSEIVPENRVALQAGGESLPWGWTRVLFLHNEARPRLLVCRPRFKR